MVPRVFASNVWRYIAYFIYLFFCVISFVWGVFRLTGAEFQFAIFRLLLCFMDVF
ncbi:hypothetical protein HanPSC8_Chr02g0045621 [Helianthus annuus]|nr:hypothetical protein HanPSC8_Chr02g0045621 [Helianthus annuus]